MSCLYDANGKQICNFGDSTQYYPSEGEEPNSVDSVLIAAAPSLLEALLGILEIGKRDMSNPKYDGYFEAAQAAVRMALTITS